MGVKKLTTFIEDKYEWEYITLRDKKLVIDGFALCFTLYFAYYSNTWYYGGDYHEYYGRVCSFFANLQKNKIDTYVVMDGIDIDQTKRKTTLKRTQDKNKEIAKLEITNKKVSPLHLIQVFLDVLREKEIKFFVADGEADPEIASLANHFRCPVLSADSDFYVFKLEGGYIPMTVESRTNLATGKPVKRFTYQNFTRQFALRDNDLMLYFPFFLGNDFHTTPVSMERLGYSEKPKAAEVVTYIQTLHSIDDDRSKRLRSIKTYYTIQNASDATFEDLKKSNKLYHDKTIPRWVLTDYKKGEFHFSLMSFIALEPKRWHYWNVIEDMQQESAWEFTRNIREATMAILTPNDRSISTSNHATHITGAQSNAAKVATIKVEPDVQIEEEDSTDDSENEKESVESLALSNSESEKDFDTDAEEESSNTLSNTHSKISGTHIVEMVRAFGEYRIKENEIQLKRGPIHNLIDYTLTWKKPESRRRALLVIADCCEIKDRLETIPEGLQLAVIATHYWIKKIPEYFILDYLLALVSCIVTCYYNYRRVRPRRRLTTAELRPLAHVFAHWQCTLHDLIALNQVLNQPYRYTSPAHLFSGTILHYFLESRNMIRDRRVTELLDVIMHRV